MKSNKWKTFLTLLFFAAAIAFFNRISRMILVTYPLMDFHFLTMKVYMPLEEIKAIRYNVTIWATSRVLAIDTLWNLFLLYLVPHLMRIFARDFSIISTLKLHKFFKDGKK